ncbi:hypothetical protein [Streptomyces sp. NPDC005181]|uniref:hypothetical protein n=1 Tax=Streptomyces sp. NPDC005181 TaxID=3156869 RepID=UPI0033A4853C
MQVHDELMTLLKEGDWELLTDKVIEYLPASERERFVERMIDHGLQESPGHKRWLELKRQLDEFRVA